MVSLLLFIGLMYVVVLRRKEFYCLGYILFVIYFVKVKQLHIDYL